MSRQSVREMVHERRASEANGQPIYATNEERDEKMSNRETPDNGQDNLHNANFASFAGHN